jgi:hypothetical protein
LRSPFCFCFCTAGRQVQRQSHQVHRYHKQLSSIMIVYALVSVGKNVLAEYTATFGTFVPWAKDVFDHFVVLYRIP